MQEERGQRGMSDQDWRVPGISIVCVFNDLAMRQDCLDRSIAAYAGDVDVDYIPVDNRQHEFTSAGAALNHGAANARHDVVVFVHQDVYLHSIDRIAEVGTHLDGDRWGVLGANGVTGDGRSYGRMRDRVLVIGEDADAPVNVDSLDEVLFLVRRDRILAHPLCIDSDLSWHAYTVEYGLRMRRLGLGVGAANLAITHNSKTINLDRLDAAHRRVATLYPEFLPVRTTCGTIGSRSSSWRDAPVIRDHRWRLRWLRGSVQTHRQRSSFKTRVLSCDIREDVDLLKWSRTVPLRVINLDRGGAFAEYASTSVRLNRYHKVVSFQVVTKLADAVSLLTARQPGESVMLSGLSMDDLQTLVEQVPDMSEWVLGVQDDGVWIFGGPAVVEPPAVWSEPRAVPLGEQRGGAHSGSEPVTLVPGPRLN
ncbi:glycosyltransferase [Intrasporangium sp.]|uniref:glycosyltransferase n=1 Tax=Intrasporangium sp. TaxID=1925024 RepID=UPI0032221F0C